MSKLDIMQRFAEGEARKLGTIVPVRVAWSGTITWKERPCKVQRNATAHAHVAKADPARGTICVRRALSNWRDTIRHEVAHFAPGSHGHGPGYLRARAQQGSLAAKRELRQAGKMRCARHVWRQGRLLSSTLTRQGYINMHEAWCSECHATRP